jgi:hypothetical protein
MANTVQTDLTAIAQTGRAPAAPQVPIASPPRSVWETRVVIAIVLVVGLALSSVVLLALRSSLPKTSLVGIGPATTLPGIGQYPLTVGIANPAESSGMAPPGPNALAGYTRTYVTNFFGRSLPKGWEDFTGVPGGDPSGHFASSHVVVANGLLRLNSWRDPHYANKWTTGGLCQCRHAFVYGAVFVRSRITGPGTNEVALLWPRSNIWPPEIDFMETGKNANSTSWTYHWGVKTDLFHQRTLYNFNLTKWNTWGVIWTPTSITFLINGKSWGSFRYTPVISNVPMTVDLEQRPACSFGIICTAAKQSLLVNWVAEYTRR